MIPTAFREVDIVREICCAVIELPRENECSNGSDINRSWDYRIKRAEPPKKQRKHTNVATAALLHGPKTRHLLNHKPSVCGKGRPKGG